MVKILSICLFALWLAVLLGGCTRGAATPAVTAPTGLRVEQAWTRPVVALPGGGMAGMEAENTAVYLTIQNGGTADRLTGAKGDIAKSVEIHQTTTEGDLTGMAPVSAIDVPPNGTIEFKPGGYHIMLVEPTRELKAGDRFSIVLVFDKAGEITVPVAVQPDQ